MKPTERLEAVREYLESEDIPLQQRIYVPLALAGICKEFQDDGLFLEELGGRLVLVYESMENEEALTAFFEIDEEALVELFGTEHEPTTIEHVISELQV
jgi:hypothetical protein